MHTWFIIKQQLILGNFFMQVTKIIFLFVIYKLYKVNMIFFIGENSWCNFWTQYLF